MKLRRLIGAGILFAPTRPSLKFDFSAGDVLDSRITFTRASSATRFNSAGTLVTMTTDQPRFDYDPVTLAAKGLLIEEARTNLCLQSETLGTTWTVSNAADMNAVTANQYVAPDGVTTMDLLQPKNTTAVHSLNQAITFAASVHTFSCYLRYVPATPQRWAALVLNDGTTTWAASFDLLNGVAGALAANTTSTISATALANVYRVTMSTTATAAAAGTIKISLNATDSATLESALRAGTETLGAWGAQLEAGAFPTSYIPTTTAAVTRAADVASITTLTPWYSQTEGTVVAEYAVIAQKTSAPASAIFVFDAGSGDNEIGIRQGSNLSGVDYIVTDSTVVQVDTLSYNIAANTFVKSAAAYKANDFAVVFASGVSPDVVTSGSVPGSVTTLRIMNRSNSTQSSGHIKRLSYFNRRLSNTQLQALTA